MAETLLLDGVMGRLGIYCAVKCYLLGAWWNRSHLIIDAGSLAGGYLNWWGWRVCVLLYQMAGNGCRPS